VSLFDPFFAPIIAQKGAGQKQDWERRKANCIQKGVPGLPAVSVAGLSLWYPSEPTGYQPPQKPVICLTDLRLGIISNNCYPPQHISY
jgi:hypothetical protein